MIAMAWRQHRLQLLAAAALLAALAGYLLIGGWQQADYAQSTGLTGCLAVGQSMSANTPPGGTSGRTRDCGSLVQAFTDHFGTVPGMFVLFTALPALAGLFWGAPLIAREIETGTYRLAFTQSVSRQRWLTVKLAGFLAAAAVAATALSLSFSWWLRTIDQISQAGYSDDFNRLNPTAFDMTGVALTGITLFAFALGTAAGALIRRTLPAMAATLAAYFAVTLPVQSLRYHVLTPLTISGPVDKTPTVQPGGYIMSTGWADAAGHPFSFTDLMQVCGIYPGGTRVHVSDSCLAAKGFRISETYQPASRYWPLQFIDTAVYGTAAIALLLLATWWTTRRIR